MDMISELPIDLLIKILLYLPTKVAVSTSILSKRWKYLWMWLPKLEYDYKNYSVSQCDSLRQFLNLKMPLHKAPIIESLCLKFRDGPGGSVRPEDIKLCVSVAVSRSVRELTLMIYNMSEYDTALPDSLYICKSIVFLKLTEDILVDVPPMACLPSLKSLFLRSVTCADKNSLEKLLSSCPVLENLVVKRYHDDNLEEVSISVNSLQRLALMMTNPCPLGDLEIKTPSLKYLALQETRDGDNDSANVGTAYDFEDMPNLEKANLDVTYPDIGKFIRLIKFAKRLQLCLGFDEEKGLYDEDINFNQLEHLKICTCKENSTIFLRCLLRDSPNLQALDIFGDDDHTLDESIYWDDDLFPVPPLCLQKTLKTLKWTGIRVCDMGLATYILDYAARLENVTFVLHSSVPSDIKDEMISDLYRS